MGLCSTVAIDDLTLSDAAIVDGQIMLEPSSSHSICDIHPAVRGTTEELRGILRKEFESIGRPTWWQRLASPIPNHLQAYCFGLDKGPENLGFATKVLAEVYFCQFICVFLHFCFSHQEHLICEDMLKLLDTWEWDFGNDADNSRYAFNGLYSGCIKTIANTWRSTGIHIKLCRVITFLFCPQITEQYFKKIITGQSQAGG